jgi:hypothetical protein
MKKLIVLAPSRLFPGRSPMKITRRFALATFLVIAVAVVIVAPAPAPASAGWNNHTKTATVKLHPAADSPSPHALGMVTLYYDRGLCYMVSVSVSQLAPNAPYYMVGADVYVPIHIDASGKGESWFGGYNSGYIIWSRSFQVFDASGTLVLTSNR